MAEIKQGMLVSRPLVPGTTNPTAARSPHPGRGAVAARLFLAVMIVGAAAITGCTARGGDKTVSQSMSKPPSAPIRLELSIAGSATNVDALRLSARYVSTSEIRLFHRMVSSRYPDELQLIFTDSKGRQTVVERIAMKLPVVSRILKEDFVLVGPSAPVAFEFPVWGAPKLRRGEYQITAVHVGGFTTYTTDDGKAVDAQAYIQPINSNPVSFQNK